LGGEYQAEKIENARRNLDAGRIKPTHGPELEQPRRCFAGRREWRVNSERRWLGLNAAGEI
jgi:hypothetical protein